MRAALTSVVETIQHIACTPEHHYYQSMMDKFDDDDEAGKQQAKLLRCVAIVVYLDYS